uniref:Ethylmalonyl-CoA decarboxylase n=1 Tax=Bos taurus TaxID=9913 RepID=H9KUU8_BOVIN
MELKQEMASLLKTSPNAVKKRLLHQIGLSLYNTSHGFHEEEVKKKLEQFPGGSIDLQKENSGIGILTLNNPSKMNAFSGVMMLQLLEKVIELENWTEGKGLIIRGAKNTFSSGSDLNAVKALGTPEDGMAVCMFMQNTLTRFMRLPLISVALVQGRALGGGAEVTTACDFRFFTFEPLPPGEVPLKTTAAAKSLQSCPSLCDPIDGRPPGSLVPGILQARTLDGLPFPSPMHESEKLMTTESEIRFVHKEMGIIPSWGGATRLVEIIGGRQALKVLSGALKLDSEKALNIGMVDDILPSSDETECLKEAQEWLQQFIKGPPEVIRALKKSVSSCKELCLEEALQRERDILGTVWGGPANLEAVARKGKFNK